ncbi:MAG: QueT transporter family protein [Faecalibacterium sp.]
MKNQNLSVRKLARCGMVAALYVVLCMALQPFSYGAVQVRVAEALCLLPVFGAEYIFGVVLGCFLANLLGSTIVDVIFGTLATLLACLVTYKLRNIRFKGLAVAASLPPVVFNAVIMAVMHMITVMLVGVAMGTTVCIGRSVGAGDKQQAAKVIGNTVTLFMVGSVVLAAALVGLVDPIVRLISTPEEAVAGTTAYLTICFIGIPCITAYNVLASIFRGMGDSQAPCTSSPRPAW